MMRLGQIIKLNPERQEEYKRLHANIWPEVARQLYDSNIRNYSIYLKDGYLFSYLEYIGEDYEADMKRMGENEICQKWGEICGLCQIPIDTANKGEWWANMEEVFHQD